jgi:hypothetical protein
MSVKGAGAGEGGAGRGPGAECTGDIAPRSAHLGAWHLGIQPQLPREQQPLHLQAITECRRSMAVGRQAASGWEWVGHARGDGWRPGGSRASPARYEPWPCWCGPSTPAALCPSCWRWCVESLGGWGWGGECPASGPGAPAPLAARVQHAHAPAARTRRVSPAHTAGMAAIMSSRASLTTYKQGVYGAAHTRSPPWLGTPTSSTASDLAAFRRNFSFCVLSASSSCTQVERNPPELNFQ